MNIEWKSSMSGSPALNSRAVGGVQAPNPDNTHSQAERERLFFEAMMRVLDRELPGYAD